jgi:hypothetical protein
METQFDYFFDCSSYATDDCDGDCNHCNFHPDYLDELNFQKSMENLCQEES